MKVVPWGQIGGVMIMALYGDYETIELFLKECTAQQQNLTR